MRVSMRWKHALHNPWLMLATGIECEVDISSNFIQWPSSSLLAERVREGAEFLRNKEGSKTRLHCVQAVKTSPFSC